MERTQKGQSLLELINSYTVIDLETTGLSPEYDDIIEVAAVKVVDGNIVERFSSLINPLFEIPEFITKLTGITNDMLSSAPTIQEVLPRFIEFLGDATLLGHNVSFDINFLYDACLQYLDKPLRNNCVDTMRISRLLFPSEEHHRLEDLRQRLNVSVSRSHRALDDVIATMDCYEKMKRYVTSNSIDFYSKVNKNHTKRKKPSSNPLRAKDLSATTDDFDVTSVAYNKSFVFTGTLERFSRKEAMQLVLNSGGKVEDNITKKTNFLVLAKDHYNPQIKDGKSRKWKQAEELKLKGQDIEIISEDVFYDMFEEQKAPTEVVE